MDVNRLVGMGLKAMAVVDIVPVGIPVPVVAAKKVDIGVYFPPEVWRKKYWEKGVFLFQYFSLVKIRKLLHFIAQP